MKPLLFSIVSILFLAVPAFPETIAFEDNWGPPGITVLEQSARGMVLNFSIPEVSFHEVAVNGERMITVGMPTAYLGNEEDAPNLPGVGRFFAFPRGAAVRWEILDSRTFRFEGMSIAPAQRIPSENDDGPPVYKKDPLIYGSDAYYPGSPVKVSDPTVLRGVDTALIGITPFQYNPVKGDLVVYSDLRIRIDYTGGQGRIGVDRLRSRYFDPILKAHLLNAGSLPVMDYDRIRTQARNDEEAEYVIIVPEDREFKDWAKVIRDYRTKQGIKTEIYSLSQVGNTAAQITTWIHNACKSWSMPPVAVLLLGDAPGSGDGKSIPVPFWSYTPSDNVYADVFGNDDLPDIVITRITARNTAELQEMIMKVIDYETNPPMDFDFYDQPMMAAGWQSDRWFVICSEIVWGYFNHVMGKRPSREYAGAPGPPGYWSTNQNTYMLVDYFGPHGLGYIPEKPSHLVDWGGNAARINQDFNDGAFFGLHRDHGSPSGWSEPHYVISDLKNLHNDMLPLVWSINCSSGAFAGSSECFAEAFYRMHHGAIGLIAASGTSYSFVNDTYVFGMMDSMFPDFDPGYGGSAGDHVLMPGFANMSGKYYLEASNWPYNSSSKNITYHLFHDHGEAFFSLCSGVPKSLAVSHASTLPLGASTFQVTADAGAVIALTVKEIDTAKIIGTGTGIGAPLDISILPQYEPRIMTVTVTKPDHVRYAADVYIPGMGSMVPYGAGLAGSGGYVPDLDGTGEPIYGGGIEINLTQGLGGTNGMLYAGLSPANLSILGGHLLVFPIQASIPILLGGTAGAPGDGSFSIPGELFISNLSLFLQVFLADPGAVKGVAMSNGLEIVFP